MSHVLTFSHLPNELIASIFVYLTPEENFRSFFNVNDRLRKLVKRHVTFSRRALGNDIERFSTLHSWYKHLSYVDGGGETFYLMPLKGEQERYNFSPSVSDYNGIHWHFWREKPAPLADKRIEQIIRKYPIKLNPSFHPDGGYSRVTTDDFRDFVRRHYPFQSNVLERTLFNRPCRHLLDLMEVMTDDIRAQLTYILDNKPKRLKSTILEAAQFIWRDLQQLEDVNILEINYHQQSAGYVQLVYLK